MERAESSNDSSNQGDWLVNDWPAAVRALLERKEVLIFRAVSAALLVPSLALAAYSVSSHRYGLLIWVALGLWGRLTCTTSPTGIGVIASFLLAGIGVVSAIAWQDWLLFGAGLLPGLTWFAGCALLGTTASYLREALQRSPESAQSLVDQGILSPARATPSKEPDS